MARTEYKPEVKAAAITALLAGQSPAVVSEEYGINLNTARQWKRRAIKNTIAVTQKKEETAVSIGDLILGLLEEELVTLQEMSRQFRDADWLKKQDAAELGVLYGVMQDKAIRKVEVLQRARPADD